MIELIVAGVVGTFSFIQTRRFVRERLRYVDAVQKPSAPVVAGVLTTLAAAPVVWVLPLLGGITAVGMGVCVAAGVSSGVKDAKRLPSI